jgi:hypothetical protein
MDMLIIPINNEATNRGTTKTLAKSSERNSIPIATAISNTLNILSSIRNVGYFEIFCNMIRYVAK